MLGPPPCHYVSPLQSSTFGTVTLVWTGPTGGGGGMCTQDRRFQSPTPTQVRGTSLSFNLPRASLPLAEVLLKSL